MMSCLSDNELLQYLDEQLTIDRARSSKAHLDACERCQQKLVGLRRLAAAIAAPAAQDDPSLFIDDVNRAIDRPHRERAPWWKYAAAATVLLCALPLSYSLVGKRPAAESGFVARGGLRPPALQRLSGVEALLVDRGKPVTLSKGTVLSPNAGLAFRYTNATTEALFLFAFAMDSRGEVHWFYPSFMDPKSNPQAIMLAPGTRSKMLPEVVRPDGCPTGPLRTVTVISRRRKSVREVEALLKGSQTTSRLADRFVGDNVQEWPLTVEAPR